MPSIDKTVTTPDVESTLVVDSADKVTWHDSADIVVVGFGAAGASAALEAHEQAPDADVLLIDRFDGGGATAYSGGVVYAGDTRHQREAGFEDTVDEMYKYLKLEVGDAVSDETLRRFCENSNKNLDWLEQHGVPFGATLCKEKTSYPPNGKFLYFSGNEKVAKYMAVAKPAPRGHRTVGKGWTGYELFKALRAAMDKSGVRQMLHAPVRRLIVDATGNVIGLEVVVVAEAEKSAHQALYKRVSPLRPFQNARADKAIAASEVFENNIKERKCIRVRRGIVLATGGFIYNVPMLRQYASKTCSDSYLALVRVGSMGCSGAGIQLGLSAGAATGKMNNVLLGRSIAPPTGLLEGLIVNQAGRRLINEDTYSSFLGDAICSQPEGKAWLILDSSTFWKVLRQIVPNGDGNFLVLKLPTLLNILFGGTQRAASLDALAAKCDIDAAGLRDEAARFNGDATKGTDPMGKSPEYLRSLGAGPYYAINMALSNVFATTLAFTLGGLTVNEDSGMVTRPNGSGIEGLYAAGRAAVGVCSNGYFSGMSLADCVFSGRRAGAALAAKHRDSVSGQ